jgi:hypothetical protein
MTTKPPSPVDGFAPDTKEKIAYDSVRDVPTYEPNDGHRLGYHVWRWLSTGAGTLEEAVSSSGARMMIPTADAVAIIRKALQERGVASPSN